MSNVSKLTKLSKDELYQVLIAPVVTEKEYFGR